MAAATPAMNHSMSFLDGLDGNCMETIFRHLSAKPSHPRWSRYIESENLIMALRCQNTFRNFALMVMSRMSTGPNIKSDRALGFTEGDVDCFGNSRHILEVTRAVGNNLKHLQLGKSARQHSLLAWANEFSLSLFVLPVLNSLQYMGLAYANWKSKSMTG